MVTREVDPVRKEEMDEFRNRGIRGTREWGN